MNRYLFLQGPHGPFFRRLGLELDRRGHTVIRVNLCGGDVVDWPSPHARLYQGRSSDWGRWIARLMDQESITDLLVFGDWRPLHYAAILLARLRGARVWAFEEGYLRPHYITMEADGVNGRSSLPRTPEGLRAVLAASDPVGAVEPVPNPLSARMKLAVRYAVGQAFLWPLFPLFRTHRPRNVWVESAGWAWRVLGEGKRRRASVAAIHRIYRSRCRYFLFPLQLDSDSQVRRYSPFSGMKEAIAYVLASFARSAPAGVHLVVRNHPLDNGLIDYRRFIAGFGAACGVADRVHFVETGNARLMLDKSEGVVVLNSTIGLSALRRTLPVYCVGTSVYAMPGLAASPERQALDEFWRAPEAPDATVLSDFVEVLKRRALVNGAFYTDKGMALAAREVLERLERAAGKNLASPGAALA